MIGIFKNNTPLALLLLALLALMPEFVRHAQVIAEMPAGSTAIFRYLFEFSAQVDLLNNAPRRFLKITILLVEALLLNKIISDQKLMERPGFVPAMAFLVLNALLPQHAGTAFLILNGIILMVLRMLVHLYKQAKPNNQLLLLGFIVGCLGTLNTSYLVLYGWITVCIMIMRPASVREWLISSLGFLLPYYFIASGLYLADRLDMSILFPAFDLSFRFPKLDLLGWIKIILFSLLPWLGITVYNKQIGKMLIQGRKAYLTMLLLNLAILVICLLSFADISTTISLMLIPSTLLFAPFFTAFKSNFIPNLLLLALVVLALLG